MAAGNFGGIKSVKFERKIYPYQIFPMNHSLILSLLAFVFCAAAASGQTRALELELIDRSKIHGETAVPNPAITIRSLLWTVVRRDRHRRGGNI